MSGRGCGKARSRLLQNLHACYRYWRVVDSTLVRDGPGEKNGVITCSSFDVMNSHLGRDLELRLASAFLKEK